MINGIDNLQGIPQEPQAITYMDLMGRMDQGFLNLILIFGGLVLVYTLYNVFVRGSPRLKQYGNHITQFFDFMILTLALFYAVVGFMYKLGIGM